MSITYGLTVMPIDPMPEFVHLVEECEQLGYTYFWVADSSLHARYCYSYLTIAAAHSTRLRIGTNCTHPFTRHPAITVNAAATIDEISAGRAVMSIGAGAEPVTEIGLRPAKVSAVREMIQLGRRLLSEDTVTDTSETWTLDRATLRYKYRSRIPMYVTASGPRMLQMGGEIADGVIFLSGPDPRCVKFALDNIQEGAARTGRSLNDIDVAWCGVGSIDEDRSRALEGGRSVAAWLVRTSPRYALLADVPAELSDRIRAAYSGSHFHEATAAMALVTDDMIESLSLSGTPDDVGRKIQAVMDLGVRHIEFEPTGPDRPTEARLFAEVMRGLT